MNTFRNSIYILTNEFHIYGSSRLGVYESNEVIAWRSAFDANNDNQLSETEYSSYSANHSGFMFANLSGYRGKIRYEMSNHASTKLSTSLGNVLAVVSDKKLTVCSSGTFVSYAAEVISATDYSPFGAPLAGRTYQASEYRFGFNGKERDDEVAGVGNIMTAEFWEYGTRLGRRWNLDPKPNPEISGYACFANNPIGFSDPMGDTIRIKYAGIDRQIEQLTYSPGMEYKGDNVFLSQTISALNSLNEGIVGSSMIGELYSSEKDITINQHSRNIAEGLNVGFNPNSIISGMNQNGQTTAPNFISLGHELAHTWDELNGTIDKSIWLSPEILQAEKFATHIENQIRVEHNLPLRTHYGIFVNSDGSYSGFGRLIIGNESLFYQKKITIELPDASLIDDGSRNINLEFMIPFRYK